MILNRKQEEGLKIAINRYENKEPYTCIAGYAGTGKSTLVSFLISALDLDSNSVAYITYTGKAAQVLQQKGCSNAMTAHKLLYHFRKIGPNNYVMYPKMTSELADVPLKLIIVDEVSMLPGNMWSLLLSHEIHIVALGDPGQLPPIYETNGMLDHPHIFLDEIMRQAKDNEIIRLSMDIREGKPLDLFNGENVKIIDKESVIPGMYSWADQIICAKNDTRKAINKFYRQFFLKIEENAVQNGDKIICLSNEWKRFSNCGFNLINGTIGQVSQLQKILGHPMKDSHFCNLTGEMGDIFSNLCINLNYDEMAMKNAPKRTPQPIAFDFGYAITCWKAQGSQWNKVLIYEENFPFDREDHKRYLYTGITRAIDKAIIVRK